MSVRGLGGGESGTHAGSPGRRTPGRRARSGCPGSWACRRSGPPVGPSGRRCPRSRRRCSHSLQGGWAEGASQDPAQPTFPLKAPRFSQAHLCTLSHGTRTKPRHKIPTKGKQRCAKTRTTASRVLSCSHWRRRARRGPQKRKTTPNHAGAKKGRVFMKSSGVGKR